MILCKERNGINAEREGKQRQTTTTTRNRLHLLRAFSCSWLAEHVFKYLTMFTICVPFKLFI